MNLWVPTISVWLAASLVAGTGTDPQAGKGTTDPTPTAETRAERKTDEAEPAVEDAVKRSADDATALRRKKLIAEAIEALDETRTALDALEKDDADGALDALALASGKLDLVVARNPRLALAPVDVRLVKHDLYATVEDVEAARKEALEHLEKGRLQDARALIEGLRSDLVVEVVSVPLATYPAAIRDISPLIDEDKTDEARALLQNVLDTLIVTEHVLPLPILRTQHMLARAEKLTTTEDRTEEQNQELAKLLEDARGQLALAKALGYGEKGEFERFDEQLDEITHETQGGKSGTGLFDAIKNALRSFEKSALDAN